MICSHSLNYKSGTGIVYSNLFRGWPLDSLAQIHVDLPGPDADICKISRQMSVDNVPLDRTFRKMLGQKCVAALGRPEPPSSSPDLEASENGIASWRLRLRMILSAWTDCVPYRLDPDFLNWLKEFSPQVIVSNLGSIRQIGLVQQISAITNAQIVPFMNDDWPLTTYQGDLWMAPPRWLLLHRLRKLMRDVSVGGAVSIDMANEYRERYGVRFEPFLYCVDAPLLPPPPPGGDVVHFCYVGNLHLDRWRSLLEIGECLQELLSTGLRAKLLVYAPAEHLRKYGRKLSGISAIELMGTLGAGEVPEALRRSHVLVHVESFHRRMRRYTRLSFSTKLPQYLAAGRLVLAYGPEELASCRYVRETGSGLLVGQQNRQLLRDTLLKILSCPDNRMEMGESAWRTARLSHEPVAMRERFRMLLANVERK
jgi:glycosyltransferase involved in cell wall biosynthesis